MKKSDNKTPYFDSLITLGSFHELFLESIRAELGRRRIRNISPLQCLTLYQIGKSSLAGKSTLSLPDILLLYESFLSRTDLVYILRKLMKAGHIVHKHTETDKNRKIYALSEKGLALYDKLNDLFEDYLQQMERSGLSIADLKSLTKMTLKLQKVCKTIILPSRGTKP